jgi:four helix bundle protein
MEIQTQLTIAKNLGYINAIQFETITGASEEVGRIIHGLIKSINKKLKAVEIV